MASQGGRGKGRENEGDGGEKSKIYGSDCRTLKTNKIIKIKKTVLYQWELLSLLLLLFALKFPKQFK